MTTNVSNTYTPFKSKIHNQHVRQVFRTWNSTSKNLIKEIESVNSNTAGRALTLNKYLQDEMKYIYKMKV